MRQALVYFPHALVIGVRTPPIDLAEEPRRVWTLYHHRDPETAPSLPIVPIHFTNAFLEDIVHDWVWRDGKFWYYTRAIDGRVWLLLEYDK